MKTLGWKFSSIVPRILLVFSVVLLTASLAYADGQGPKEKPGNNGVPGLIAEISALEEQVTALNVQIAQKDAEIADLHDQIDEKDEIIADLYDQIDTKDTIIAELLAQNTALQAQVVALQEQNTALQAQVAALQEQIAALQDQIAALLSALPIQRTGQTECWDQDGNPISCTGTGQDGELQLGVSGSAPRFTDNGNGTVTDNLTALIWLKDGNCLGPDDGLASWQEALNAANNLANGQCGLTDGSAPGDWHLPNVRELQTLVDFGQGTPAIDELFTVGGPGVWTSTTVQSAPEHAWFVNFSDGSTLQSFMFPANALFPEGKTGFPARVLPVRGELAD